MQTRRYVGIDLGKRSMEVHFIDEKEKHETWNCKTDAEGRLRLLKKLKQEDVISMEACPLAFILEAMIRKQVGAKVFVLNPLGLAMIYRSTKKTDREDAAKLAWVIQRLPEKELPTVTVPTEQEQEIRYLVSEQVGAVQSRTRELNRLHALFVQEGITTLRKKDLKKSENRKKHFALLSPSFRSRAERFERVLSSLEQNLEEIEAQLQALISGHELTPYLLSIPGVGPGLVAAFLGFLGDGKRFTLKTVASYAGMVPRVDCSGDQKHYGPITKRGCPLLRRALVQGAWGLTRTVNTGILGKKYLQWKETKSKSKAIVALARKMLETMWVLATRKIYYRDYDPVKFRIKLASYVLREEGAVGAA